MVFGAEGVNRFGPVGPVGYAHFLSSFKRIIGFMNWVSMWLVVELRRNRVRAEESKGNGHGFAGD